MRSCKQKHGGNFTVTFIDRSIDIDRQRGAMSANPGIAADESRMRPFRSARRRTYATAHARTDVDASGALTGEPSVRPLGGFPHVTVAGPAISSLQTCRPGRAAVTGGLSLAEKNPETYLHRHLIAAINKCHRIPMHATVPTISAVVLVLVMHRVE